MEGATSAQQKREEILTADQVASLVRAASSRSSTGIRNRALIALLYRGGLRLSDALRLLPTDAHPAEQRLRVARDGGDRFVALDEDAFRLIDCWLERRREIGLAATDPLFSTLQGEAVLPSYVRSMLSRLAEKAGIQQRVSPEILRRTLAAELVREGLPVSVIQAQLGHVSSATTQRYLGRLLSPAELEAAAAAVRGRDGWCY